MIGPEVVCLVHITSSLREVEAEGKVAITPRDRLRNAMLWCNDALMHWGYRRNLDDTMRSEEHTSELQSLMRISYAVFCLKKKNNTTNTPYNKYTRLT